MKLLTSLFFFATLVCATISAQTPTYQIAEIARTGDAVPGGNGSFVTFPDNPCGSVGLVLFPGKGSNGEDGLYLAEAVGPPCLVADKTTSIPGGQGTFTGFGGASLDGVNVAFRALGSGGQDGIYTHFPTNSCNLVANTSSPIPGGQGNFTGFGGVSIDGVTVAFGGFGTGGQQGIYTHFPTEPCNLVADTSSPIPGGQGNFTGFGGVSIDGVTVAFGGFGTGGQQGIYTHFPTQPCNLVADLGTAIPGGQLGNFTAFPEKPCNNQGNVAFAGAGPPGYFGAFLYDGNGLITLVDTDAPVPGGNGNYSQFGEASLAKDALAFHGYGTTGEEGIYIAYIPPNPCQLVADLATPIPGGQGNFTGFEGVSHDGTHVAFVGLGSKAIYSNVGGNLEAVIAVGDMIGNDEVADLSIGPDALSGNQVAFWASFTDSSEGVFLATATTGTGVGDTHPPSASLNVQNYPNPFARTTEIQFSLPAAGDVSLEVFDVAGRRVMSQSISNAPAGPHQIPFDGSTLLNGVYFYRVVTPGQSASGKMLIRR